MNTITKFEILPLDVRTSHWKQSYIFDGLNISGYSKAAYRTGFYIKEYDLMLDAGHQAFNKPKHILITHGHLDHIVNLPLSLINDTDNEKFKFEIYAPFEIKELLKMYIQSTFNLNICGLSNVNIESWYNFTELKKNMKFNMNANGNNLEIETFTMDHTIPTLGYGICVLKEKLKQELINLPKQELILLKKNGHKITETIKTNKLAYICDTSINVFKLNNNILSYKNIIIECTFLYDNEIENAIDTKHICWIQLKPYVINNPHIHFILIHFSLKYKDEEIKQFFDLELININNVKIWL